MALRVSEYTPATPPISGTSLVGLSVPSGSPSGFDTVSAEISDLLAVLFGTGVIESGDPATAPGAGKLRIAVVAGTDAGTAKVLLYAGTSTTPVVLADNVGSGF